MFPLALILPEDVMWLFEPLNSILPENIALPFWVIIPVLVKGPILVNVPLPLTVSDPVINIDPVTIWLPLNVLDPVVILAEDVYALNVDKVVSDDVDELSVYIVFIFTPSS